MSSDIDFAYPWFLTYGHLVVTAIVLALWLLGRAHKWRKLPMLIIAAVGVWSVAAFLVARFALDVNGRLPLPTERFLASGQGRVLDMGAGTGRASLMVLEARPRATVVALDLFADSYRHHFGAEQSGQEKLLANLKAAGLDGRASIQAGDMRKLPFDASAFDAVVSTYAIDHLGRDGAVTALKETYRVLKSGGDFLFMIIAKDPWLNFAFGPLLLHSGTRSADWWTSRTEEAGFQVLEQGRRPATLYVLARKP